MNRPENDAQFTVLDWIGTVVAAFAALGLLLFPLVSRSYDAMFQDFNARLPLLTKLVITGWLPVLLGLLVAIGVGAGALRRAPLSQRRALVIGAFVLGTLGFGLCWLGLYLPIFELAGSIKAE